MGLSSATPVTERLEPPQSTLYGLLAAALDDVLWEAIKETAGIRITAVVFNRLEHSSTSIFPFSAGRSPMQEGCPPISDTALNVIAKGSDNIGRNKLRRVRSE